MVPLGPGFATELRGVDLIDVVSSDAAYRAVREAFEEYSVIVFRGQQVSDDIQAGFSRAFGPLERTKVGLLSAGAYTSASPTSRSTARSFPKPTAGRLSTGQTSSGTPTARSKRRPRWPLCYRRGRSDEGGETEFTSTRLAWDRLPGEQKKQLRDLVVVHSYANSRDQIDPQLMTPEERAALPPVRWRMTWRNPANGRDALYIASHAAAVEGMGDNEGKALLARLIDEATQEPRTYLHRWRTGDVVMWDNRASMHRGRPWPGSQARLMVRTTISAREADGLDRVRPN